MNFFFRQTEIILDAFTYSDITHKLFPIQRYDSTKPRWFKSLNSTYNTTVNGLVNLKHPTIKHCPGLLDLYKRSFCVPLWSDLSIGASEEDIVFAFSDASSPGAVSHSVKQIGNNFPQFSHLKLNSPWVLKSKKELPILMFGETLLDNYTGDIIYPQGITSFHSISNQLNINMMFRKRPQQYDFKSGEPIALLLPLTDKKVRVKTHLVSSEEFYKLHPMSLFSFIGSYQKYNSRCPINF